ncbi:MAG: class I mannose-6-phosphate isomerase [Treponema sp.]|jgi:mannose-6-phosphate isomerase|nr:class I mannose-6-phosphate isomerase [Treponema sp.]
MNSAAEVYPLEFIPIPCPRIWGGSKLRNEWNKDFSKDKIGESWELSCVPGAVSLIKSGEFAGKPVTEALEKYGAAILGDKVYAKYGAELPLLFKLIDASENLSVQVHPDDVVAKKRHNCFGKTEMWFVAQAEKNSMLYSGFAQPVRKEYYMELIKSGKILEMLASHTVKTGDSFFIPAGRVHGIGAGIVIAEIQQSSDVTYRIFDYHRKDSDGNERELHIAESVDVVDFNVKPSYKTEYTPHKNEAVSIACCEHFTVNYIPLTASIKRDLGGRGSFVVYMCLTGAASLDCGGKTAALKKGSTVLVPAALAGCIELHAAAECVMLETFV